MSCFRPKPRFISATTTALLAVTLSTHAFAWTQTSFQTHAVRGPRFPFRLSDADDMAQFSQAADAYFTMVSAERNYPKISGKPDCRIIPIREEMDSVLVLAGRNSLKTFATEWGFTSALTLFEEDDCEVRAAGEALIDDMVGHYTNPALNPNARNAVYGYFYTDEPPDSSLTLHKAPDELIHCRIGNLVEYMKTVADVPLIINLLPAYAFTTTGHTYSNYNTYLDRYLTNLTGPDALEIVSFDHYPFRYTASHWDTAFNHSYFYNLRTIRQKAGSRPIWAAVLTTKYAPDGNTIQWNPREPHIRFCALSSVAYGAKAISYLGYALPATSCSPEFKSAVVNACDASLYESVKELNRYLTTIVGPIVMSSTSLGGFHQHSQSELGETLPASSVLPNSHSVVVTALKNGSSAENSLMVGLWQDVPNDIYYGMVVNQDTSSTFSDVKVVLNGDYRTKVAVGPRLEGYAGSTTFSSTTVTYASGQSTFTIGELNPGDARLFSVYVGLAPPPMDREADIDFEGTANDGFSIKFSNAPRVPLTFEVFDVQGRRLRRIALDSNAESERRIVWDGRDHSGTALAPGVYLYRASAGPARKEGKVTIMK